MEPGAPFADTLVDTFLAALDPAARASLGKELVGELVEERGEERGALRARLERVVLAAEAGWPALTLPRELFLRHAAERAPSEGSSLGAFLDELRAADLYLACACLASHARALGAFESHCGGEIDGALRRMKLGSAVVDDVKQTLRRELFVRDAAEPERRPKIASYDGRGDLRAWVRVTAVRLALKHVRKERHELPVEDDRLLEIPAPVEDADLDHLRRRYRDAFKAAFVDALAALEPRDQNLLRQQFLDGLGIDELGALYRVHRATAARWLATARERLLDGTRERLMELADVSAGDCDSIMRLVHSRLDLTLSRLFAPHKK